MTARSTHAPIAPSPFLVAVSNSAALPIPLTPPSRTEHGLVQVGPHICVFKTHVDVFDTWSEELAAKLRLLADKHGALRSTVCPRRWQQQPALPRPLPMMPSHCEAFPNPSSPPPTLQPSSPHSPRLYLQTL